MNEFQMLTKEPVLPRRRATFNGEKLCYLPMPRQGISLFEFYAQELERKVKGRRK